MPQIDGLRAIAVGAVFVHHLLNPVYLPSLLNSVPFGMGGVRLFFVISGFLITGILLRARVEATRLDTTRGFVVRQFYARRFLRIFPLYYAVIAFAALINLPPTRKVFWWLASYLYNYHIVAQGWYDANVAHFWSLAVEEQFYLVWPWFVLFAPRKRLLSIGVAMVAVGPVSRGILVALDQYGPAQYVLTPSCLDSLGCGALLAMATNGGGVPASLVAKLARTALPIGLISSLLIKAAGTWKYGGQLEVILYDAALALFFTWLVAAAGHGFTGVAGKALMARPVAYLGSIAYGLYVYHALLIDPLARLGARLGLWHNGDMRFFLVSTVASVLLASLSWHLYERPINNLKRYFPYRREVTAQPVEAIATAV